MRVEIVDELPRRAPDGTTVYQRNITRPMRRPGLYTYDAQDETWHSADGKTSVHYASAEEMARDVRDYDAAKAEGGPMLSSEEMRAELGLEGER